MLCTSCQFNTATTSQGLCDVCVQAAAASAPPPVPPAPAGAWLRSPVGLGRAVVVLLGVVIATDLYALWAGTVMRDVMNDLITGDYGTDIEREAQHADVLYAQSGSVQLVALIATCVVFLVWFRRVRVNAEVFEPYIHRKTRGWTVWGWFVPVVNLWFPRRIALDIWDASGDRSVAPDRTLTLDASAARGPHPLINAWWTLWVANILVSRWASRVYGKAEEAEEIRSALNGMMLTDALDIAAAVLAIVFVLRLTRMQDRKARLGPPLAQPAPEPFAAP
ncbi:DUF4328 domain-containing protein [Streptomyces sp. NPDC003006]